MNEVRVLTLLELRSLYGFNRFRYTKDPKTKNQFLLVSGVGVLLVCMLLFYVGVLVYALCSLGLSLIVPAYLCAISAIFIFMFGIFRAGPTLFGSRGYDLLASMPIQIRSIVISRLISMYVENLALTGLVLLPGTVVFGICQRPPVWFYLIAALGAILLPVVPLLASALVGWGIMAFSSRFKHKTMLQTVLLLVFAVGAVLLLPAFSGNMETFNPEQLFSLAQSLGKQIALLYPPAAWLGRAMIYADLLAFLWLFLLSAGTAVASVLLLCRSYAAIMQRLQRVGAAHNYQIGEMERRGLLKTLYVREWKRYFSSSIYVSNTILGPIFGCMLSGVILFMGVESVQQKLPINIVPAIPAAWAAVFCMMPTSCSSVSIEGKHIWVIKSLPIPTKSWLDAKILLNLSLMLPFYLLSEVFLLIALRPDPLHAFGIILLPAAIVVFSVVLGVTVNLKFRNFVWEKEEQVIKQGAAVFFGGFAGPVLSLLLAALLILLPQQMIPVVHFVLPSLLALLTFFLYRTNNNMHLEDL